MRSPRHKLRTRFIESKLTISLKHVAFVLLWLGGFLYAEPLTLPLEQRPEWLQRQGIVMAGSWEPLLFRVRRDGSQGYTPTAQQRQQYLREHSPEMIARLKELGVNFVMMHCYKGAGLAAERESMADAVRFARLCHDAGLHVGVYNYSGAFLWELLFEELSQARDWVLLDGNGNPRTYGGAAYRYYWNRNHRGARAYYRRIVEFAANDIKADLLHFDNYSVGPGSDANSVRRFRLYLADTFAPEQLERMEAGDLDAVQPPMSEPTDSLLRRAWLDFCCQSLAESYHDMSRYARTLRRDILIECNPGGPGPYIRPPIDHGLLLQGGEAFWDESRPSGYHNGRLRTRVRTYKVARGMDNIAFAYTTTPLEMAESMAFNRDCLGCVCWFEYGEIVVKPGSKDPVSADLAPFIRFFHTHRDLFRRAEVVADVAVLRSFPSQVFADANDAMLTYQVEQALIDNRTCFQVIYDQQLGDLRRYGVLVLAGCVALSDQHIKQIERYVKSGGRLCIVGPVATHDEWMVPRGKPALAQLPSRRAVRIAKDADVLDAIHELCEGDLTLSVRAGDGLLCELTKQTGRYLVHLVNYRPNNPATDIVIRLQVPAGHRVKMVALTSPERKEDLKLSFVQQEGTVKFNVPKVGVYEIAAVTLSSLSQGI